MLDEKLLLYSDTFHEPFPLFMVQSMASKEIVAIIDQCVADGKPYVPDAEVAPEIDY